MSKAASKTESKAEGRTESKAESRAESKAERSDATKSNASSVIDAVSKDIIDHIEVTQNGKRNWTARAPALKLEANGISERDASEKIYAVINDRDLIMLANAIAANMYEVSRMSGGLGPHALPWDNPAAPHDAWIQMAIIAIDVANVPLAIGALQRAGTFLESALANVAPANDVERAEAEFVTTTLAMIKESLRYARGRVTLRIEEVDGKPKRGRPAKATKEKEKEAA